VQGDFPQRHLRCPSCRAERTLNLVGHESDQREVREGTLTCSGCHAEFPVHRGVAHLMPDPPEHVAREAAGLGRFADYMKADGWDADKIRRLPEIEDGYWYVQRRSMSQLLNTVELLPGQSLLDVGSNTCWAANHFAVRGLEVIALDISTTEMQGLYTSDYFIADGTSYFERVLASMNDMPLASNTLDYVFCCEVLHHNDTDGLRLTMREAFRVLKPGGKLLVVNETLKTLSDPDGVHTEGVEQFEGYEHAHWALRYRWEAIRAGFRTTLMEPHYNWFFDGRPDGGPVRNFLRGAQHGDSTLAGARSGTVWALRSNGAGRRAYLEWLNQVRGGVQFNMIATKPSDNGGLRDSLLRTARSG
jgi:SAM-dependent methyltransferase/uncharacterized protein YbaR (Trm112 family)